MASTQLPAAVPNATYNANNQLTQWGNTSMTYDPNGNTLSDGLNTYVWDARYRLVSANNNGAAFAYDAVGRRIGKNVLSANTNYLYDGLNPVQEMNGSSVTAELLTGGVDEYFTRTDSSGASSFLTDALGSTEALTDSGGNAQVNYSYAPYGAVSITGATNNSYTYNGREIDGLGINYYRARYYNPAIGRFLSEDPLGFAGSGPNLYAYALDDPIDFKDPLGLYAPGEEEKWDDLWDTGNPFTVFRAKQIALEALADAVVWAAKYAPGSMHNGPADAFRHCFWSCTMARYLGEANAAMIANAHEEKNDREDDQPLNEEQMDRSNNRVGRTCAANAKGKNCWDACTDSYLNGNLYGLGGLKNSF